MVDGKGKNAGAPLKNCSGPENKDAWISFGKCSARQYKISFIFEHLDCLMGGEVQNAGYKSAKCKVQSAMCTLAARKGEYAGAPLKICSGPENKNSSIFGTGHAVILM